MKAAPQKEHEWLGRLVGEWTYESEAASGPGQHPARHTGTERVRSLDGVWVVCEGQGDGPAGEAHRTMMTLGYDPAKGRYVGTFVGSMMAYLWLYEGELDPAGDSLTLYAEGPSFAAEGETAKYKDVIALRSDDHRVFTSSFLGDDGTWHAFMTAHYRRSR